MAIRVRFAPSPTGQVHIGNIRTAIFNWLFARHEGGEFLLRIEDTDLERSTPEAIRTLLECMEWLGLDYDGIPMYQTAQAEKHRSAALQLQQEGHAYKLNPEEDSSPVYFRIPYDCDALPFVRSTGEVSVRLAAGTTVFLSRSGVQYQTLSAKGKTVDNQGCLAGFKELKVLDGEGKELYALTPENLPAVLGSAEALSVEGASELKFIRREVFYRDMVKGELAKPLNSMKDFIIVRSDSSPVFHLANVLDDMTQGVTHIIRGDDHVENTYRHLFLFSCLGGCPPFYAHLPMIVNDQGKPYSKRDGDAFVGDFREKGFLPEALFNYLALLGWSPGDNREKMSREELAEAFQIERVQHAPARFDMVKLLHMNGMYLSEMPAEEFIRRSREFASRYPWYGGADGELFACVARLMQSRTKVFTDIDSWSYFFVRDYPCDAKASRKFLSDASFRSALERLAEELPRTDGGEGAIESAIRRVESEFGIREGKLNQPLRVAVTGSTVGAGVYETVSLLGVSESSFRIHRALDETPA